jgi:hypothetical protein
MTAFPLLQELGCSPDVQGVFLTTFCQEMARFDRITDREARHAEKTGLEKRTQDNLLLLSNLTKTYPLSPDSPLVELCFCPSLDEDFTRFKIWWGPYFRDITELTSNFYRALLRFTKKKFDGLHLQYLSPLFKALNIRRYDVFSILATIEPKDSERLNVKNISNVIALLGRPFFDSLNLQQRTVLFLDSLEVSFDFLDNQLCILQSLQTMRDGPLSPEDIVNGFSFRGYGENCLKHITQLLEFKDLSPSQRPDLPSLVEALRHLLHPDIQLPDAIRQTLSSFQEIIEAYVRAITSDETLSY